MTVAPALAPAYEHCRRVARDSASSFYSGMRLLAPDRRAALFAVYALARRIDDIADGDLGAADKLAELGRTREALHRIGESDDPVLVAVDDAARRFPIPLAAFDDLIDGAELDVRETEYVTFADLERYCRCVAGSIGRLALGVFDCSDRHSATVLADDLGVALQLGNTLRDLEEDSSIGRVYLPREDLERFGCTVRDGRFEGPIELVIAFGAQRGLGWLERGLALVPLLDRRSAACVLAMAGKYRRLLDRIAADPMLVLNGRISLRPWEKGLVRRPQLDRSRRMTAVDSTRPRIAVVGGGLAGLAAAIECADAGAAVTLYEGRSRLGGATFSFQRNGLWLDNGQHVALRCCTSYVEFLRRIGTGHLLAFQRRVRVPVLREGKRPALISRTGLPAPLHLALTLLRYRPLSARERLAAIRAATALRRLDPDDPALDEQTFGRWLRAHGQSTEAIAALWNLIALPTLNLPADEASLASAVKVFRTGLLDSADGCDIGVPAAPFQHLHADPAAAALERAGGRICMGTPVRAVTGELRLLLDDGADDADAVVVAVPHEAVASLVPAAAVAAESLAGLGTSPIVNLHVHYNRRVLDEPLAAGLDSPCQWIFDRTEASGAGAAGGGQEQLIAVSLSHATEEIGASVTDLRRRYLPALERLLPAARGAEVLDFAVTHEPRATFRVAPGTRKLRPGPRTAVRGLFLAGAWTDTGWPPTMEGAVRSGLAAARAALTELGTGRRSEPVGARR